MVGEPDKDVDVVEKSKEKKSKKKQRGLIARIWDGLFGSRNDDFERRLERISKEEATLLHRMRKRSQSFGSIKRHLILFSVLSEVMAVGYALLTARSIENWKKRAFHVLPIFLLPVVSAIIYTTLVNFMKMCDRKDQKTLEDLRDERQSKIDELKEKTNYYITQQLIQKYDTDPTAKAAAATILASKLGADSGLKVYVRDDSDVHSSTGKSNDSELVQSDGLRRRNHPRSRSAGSSPVLPDPDPSLLQQIGDEIAQLDQPTYVDHYKKEPGSDAYSGGWLARVAALLVGEDPTQCFALICGNCQMHNGLASKEDFPYLTYICPHCRAVNGPRKRADSMSRSSSPRVASPRATSPRAPFTLAADNVKVESIVNESPTEATPENVSNEVIPSPVNTYVSDKDASYKEVAFEDKQS